MNAQHKNIPVRLAGLDDGLHTFHFTVDPAEIELPPEFDRSVEVRVDLDKTHQQTALHTFVNTTAVYPCDRCLRPVALAVETDFRLLYVHDNSAEIGESDEDIRRIDVNHPVIDLSSDVRDAALVQIPMRRICGEDEEGEPLCRDAIPPERDADEHPRVDPRWDKLRSVNFDQ
ncbi:MAG: DUF177 domain-containing protein [Bacteroidetes bacterium]|nr:DUF177 domain-containing protein [Bacteroidota bacterium]